MTGSIAFRWLIFASSSPLQEFLFLPSLSLGAKRPPTAPTPVSRSLEVERSGKRGLQVVTYAWLLYGSWIKKGSLMFLIFVIVLPLYSLVVGFYVFAMGGFQPTIFAQTSTPLVLPSFWMFGSLERHIEALLGKKPRHVWAKTPSRQATRSSSKALFRCWIHSFQIGQWSLRWDLYLKYIISLLWFAFD